MAISETGTVFLEKAGKELNCVLCGHAQFTEGQSKLPSPMATHFGVEWAGHTATYYICDRCGFVHWFY